MSKQNPNDLPAKQTAVFNYSQISFEPTPEEWALNHSFQAGLDYDSTGALILEENPFYFDTSSIIHCLINREPVGAYPHAEDVDAGVKIQSKWASSEWPAHPFVILLQQLRARDALINQLADECNRLYVELQPLKEPLFAGSGLDQQKENEPKATGKFTREIIRK